MLEAVRNWLYAREEHRKDKLFARGFGWAFYAYYHENEKRSDIWAGVTDKSNQSPPEDFNKGVRAAIRIIDELESR